jgi:hypothetical protein
MNISRAGMTEFALSDGLVLGLMPEAGSTGHEGRNADERRRHPTRAEAGAREDMRAAQ